MAKKVLKFGGTSVGSIKRILHAAKIVKKEHDNGNKLIVVESAMAGTKNNLIEYFLTQRIGNPNLGSEIPDYMIRSLNQNQNW